MIIRVLLVLIVVISAFYGTIMSLEVMSSKNPYWFVGIICIVLIIWLTSKLVHFIMSYGSDSENKKVN